MLTRYRSALLFAKFSSASIHLCVYLQYFRLIAGDRARRTLKVQVSAEEGRAENCGIIYMYMHILRSNYFRAICIENISPASPCIAIHVHPSYTIGIQGRITVAVALENRNKPAPPLRSLARPPPSPATLYFKSAL